MMMNKVFLSLLIVALIPIALSVCPAETFDEKVWPETEAGQNATSSTGCPSGHVGGYLRECDTNNTWSSTVVDACLIGCASDIVDGISYPETLANETASVSCPTGFTGSKSRLCSATGQWETPTGECVPVSVTQCPEEDAGGYHWNATDAGQTATLACAEGYSGSLSRVCSAEGEWSEVSGECNRNMCQEQEFGGHLWPETPSFEDASIPCDGGRTGSFNRTCLSSGTWDSEIRDFCESIMCAAEQFDGIMWPETPAGQTFTADCPVGQSGQKTRVCSASGQWEAPSGVCTALSCSQVEEGFFTWPMTQATHSIELPCPVGMRGSASRTCDASGTWGPINSSCEGTTCQREQAEGRMWEETPANGQRVLPCASSTTGSLTRYCLTTGEWSAVFGSCCREGSKNSYLASILCPVDTVNGVTFGPTAAGQMDVQSCPSYQAGSITRQCNERGEWMAPQISCQAIKCAAQNLTLPSGIYQLPDSDSGDQVLDCNSGYTGSVTITCSIAFEWSQPRESCEHFGCGGTILDGVSVPETVFGDSVVVPCPQGFEEGVMNVTCLSSGWGTPSTPCTRITCSQETVDNLSWPSSNAGTTATLPCSQKNPKLFGVITRVCSLDGSWESPQEQCYEGAPTGFQYPMNTVEVPRQVAISTLTPSAVVGAERFKAIDELPYGLTVDAATGVISGTPYPVVETKSYRIAAINAHGQAEATVLITVKDNVCPADGVWYAAYNGQELSMKCSFLGKETRKCSLNEGRMEVVWEEVSSQCTMMLLIVVAVVVVVVLVIILVLIIVLRMAGGTVRYDRKKAQRKMMELACV